MTGIIVTGHGNISSGLDSAVRLVFGIPEKFSIVDFTEDVTPDMLEEKIKEKIDELNSGEGILIFTDIAGGTPFKTASVLSLENKNIKVISGTNLPMILETICERENSTAEELYRRAIETGKNEVKGFELKERKASNEDSEDEGI